MDLTMWAFATEGSNVMPACASCHPGSGGVEYDRDGNRLDQYLAEHPDIADQPDGDYYQSHWDQSGVLEADCMLCHDPDYSWSTRVGQLAQWNLKWSATAASGLAKVEGAVQAGQTPSVTYNLRNFNQDGTVIMNIVAEPPDANCNQCHGFADSLKRGFSWDDPHNPDVHNEQGLTCVTCHPSDMDHNIAKGRTTVETVAPDNYTQKTCQDCHTTGYNGAPIPEHNSIPASHLDSIACETCHIPSLNIVGRKVLDTSTGAQVQSPTVPGAQIGTHGEWTPDYWRGPDGKLYPVNTMILLWFGNKDEAGTIWPLYNKETAAAYETVKDQIADDNGDGMPEVNTEAEISTMLKALQNTLASNPRFDHVDPIFVDNPYVYEFDANGDLVTEDAEEAGVEAAAPFSISHNVAPAGVALGANGCEDCHQRNSQIFAAQSMVNPMGPGGQATFEPEASRLGLSDAAAGFLGFVVGPMNHYWQWLLGAVLVLILLHYVLIGPHRVDESTLNEYRGTIEAFSPLERIAHLAVLTTFVLLAITGLGTLFGAGRFLSSIFGGDAAAQSWHAGLGVVFGLGVLFMAFKWARDGRLVNTDSEWLRHLGGYLGYHGRLPEQGRFNAGQKIYYWSVVVGGIILAITGTMLVFRDHFSLTVVFITAGIHIVFAVLGVSAVVGHAYLGTLANPGTISAMLYGKVNRAWAKVHHGAWFQDAD